MTTGSLMIISILLLSLWTYMPCAETNGKGRAPYYYYYHPTFPLHIVRPKSEPPSPKSRRNRESLIGTNKSEPALKKWLWDDAPPVPATLAFEFVVRTNEGKLEIFLLLGDLSCVLLFLTPSYQFDLF